MNHTVKSIVYCLPVLALFNAQAMEADIKVALVVKTQSALRDNKLLTACLAHAAYFTPEVTIKNTIDTQSEFLKDYPLLHIKLEQHQIEYLGSITAGKNEQLRVLGFYCPAEKQIIYVVRGTFPQTSIIFWPI